MFTNGRSGKVVFVAHCLLNQNALSDQTAVYPAAFRDVVDFFLEQDVEIVQMPCPELCCLDLGRGDPDNGAALGTRWEELLTDWVCPLCGAGKDAFTTK